MYLCISVLIHIRVGDPNDEVAVAWAAPESLLKREYTLQTEVFSASHTVHEILSHGVHPYQELGNMDIKKKYQQVKLPRRTSL